ncbi:hypothetical protein KO361_04015 [Candidatus Woesearchaeota archaeon]|nr:hypothetical protein [Candidatus Woesearchaeota archaeon]
MKIEPINKIEFSELEQKIRTVPLMQKNALNEEILVYQNSDITFRELSPFEVNPTTFYLIEKNLKFQKELRKHLLTNFGIDSLHLDAAYELKNEKGEIWTLTPPIIEVTPRTVMYVPNESEIKYNNKVKIQIPIINDGAHRVALAIQQNQTFTGVFISKTNEEFPFYAHPNAWADVKVVQDVPATKEEKKFYSRENCYALYRDFGKLGCGAPRGTKK